MLGYFIFGVIVGWAFGTFVVVAIIRNKRMRRARAQIAMMNLLNKIKG